jgi:hypothetical protein
MLFFTVARGMLSRGWAQSKLRAYGGQMKGTSCENKATLRTLLSLVLVSVWMPLMPQTAASSDSDESPVIHRPSPATESVEEKVPRLQKPAMKIYIDPKTGNFSDPPAQQLPAESRRSLDLRKTSLLELSPASSPRPGGGVMIDLKGRFRNPLKVNRSPDSKLTFGHDSEPANSSEKK